MRAPPPGQVIYISKGEQDHGPFNLEELIERISKGEFAASDLSWHQGVSNWMALEQLPEWPTIQEKIDQAQNTSEKSSITPPNKDKSTGSTPSSGPSLFDEVAKATPKVGPTAPPQSEAQGALPKSPYDYRSSSKNSSGPDHSSPKQDKGEPSGILNKILVGMAILFFLATVCFAGFILYKKGPELGLW